MGVHWWDSGWPFLLCHSDAWSSFQAFTRQVLTLLVFVLERSLVWTLTIVCNSICICKSYCSYFPLSGFPICIFVFVCYVFVFWAAGSLSRQRRRHVSSKSVPCKACTSSTATVPCKLRTFVSPPPCKCTLCTFAHLIFLTIFYTDKTFDPKLCSNCTQLVPCPVTTLCNLNFSVLHVCKLYCQWYLQIIVVNIADSANCALQMIFAYF